MKTYLKSLAIKCSFALNAVVLFAAFVFYGMQPQGAIGFGRTLGFGTDTLAPLVTAANTPLPVARQHIAKAEEATAPRPAEKPAPPTPAQVQ